MASKWNPTQAKYEGKQLIKLLIRTNDTDLQSSRTEVPVRAHVAFGRLEYSDDATAFLHQGPAAAPIIRAIPITNRFKEPLTVYRAEVCRPQANSKLPAHFCGSLEHFCGLCGHPVRPVPWPEHSVQGVEHHTT